MLMYARFHSRVRVHMVGGSKIKIKPELLGLYLHRIA